ncbi:MAG: tetratricopeptide repeat protein [Polyangiaceae bacterium]
MRLGVLVACALCAACDRSPASAREQPAPSASVIAIGVAPNTCSDVSVCEAECDGGSADRCRMLAETYASGRGVDKDEAKATGIYHRACDMGDPSACVFAGRMHEFAHGVTKDDGQAARLYERSCDLGWATGCYNLALMYERGTGVVEDPAKAKDLYQRVCAAGASQACDKAKGMTPSPGSGLEGGSR